MFDLSKLNTVAACNKGVEYELRAPGTEERTGIFFNILGRDSDAFQEHVRNSIDTRLRREAMAKKRGLSDDIHSVATGEKEGIGLLVACTIGWRSGDEPFLFLGSEKLAFNAANANKIYTEYPWIRRQIDATIGDIELFLNNL